MSRWTPCQSAASKCRCEARVMRRNPERYFSNPHLTRMAPLRARVASSAGIAPAGYAAWTGQAARRRLPWGDGSKPPPEMLLAPAAPAMALQYARPRARSRDRVLPPTSTWSPRRSPATRSSAAAASSPCRPCRRTPTASSISASSSARTSSPATSARPTCSRACSPAPTSPPTSASARRATTRRPARATWRSCRSRWSTNRAPKDLREKAEDLTARGVRRVIALFVKTGKVCQWSRQRRWLGGPRSRRRLDDPCLTRPLRVRALLDAAEADDAVARALVEKRNPVLEGLQAERFAAGVQAGVQEGTLVGMRQGKASAILLVLAARGLATPEEVRARIARLPGRGDPRSLARRGGAGRLRGRGRPELIRATKEPGVWGRSRPHRDQRTDFSTTRSTSTSFTPSASAR